MDERSNHKLDRRQAPPSSDADFMRKLLGEDADAIRRQLKQDEEHRLNRVLRHVRSKCGREQTN